MGYSKKTKNTEGKNIGLDYDEIFPKRFRELVKDMPENDKQDILAEKLGVSRQTISVYMNGTSAPDYKKLKIIAEYFDVPCDYLVGITNSKSKDAKLQVISKMTGLSDKSIEALIKTKKLIAAFDIESLSNKTTDEELYDAYEKTQNHCSTILDTINFLLEELNENKLSLLNHIDKYLNETSNDCVLTTSNGFSINEFKMSSDELLGLHSYTISNSLPTERKKYQEKRR